MTGFLTLEDINTILFRNQKGFLYEIPFKVSDEEFSNVGIDFCKVSRTKNGDNYTFTIEVNNVYWNGEYYFKQTNGTYINSSGSWSNNKLTFTTTVKDIVFVVYLNNLNTSFSIRRLSSIPYPFDITHRATLKDIDKWVDYDFINLLTNEISHGRLHLKNGLFDWSIGGLYFYYVGTLIKTDFQFDCTQSLTLGKVNTVQLGALADYKPNGDLVGEYTPTITVKYGSSYIPVTFDTSLNDYVFNLDLTGKQTEGKVKLTVFVDTNEVLNSSETDVVLNSSFETINNFSKLQTLFSNGGIGRLGADITLTTDLTVTESVYLIGNNRTLNMQSHKIIVPSEKTLKAENTIFNNGKNTIQQNTGSNVELTECEFYGATGIGSVIDCQVDINNLNTENDFTTILTDCRIGYSTMAILHGGNLTVTNCSINSNITDKNYPYFLYQTDGEAVITGSEFILVPPMEFNYDVEFNTCIFVCGENATINGLNHSELQNNNLTSFLTTQRNTSTIDITYYYDLIEALVHFESDNGYCHSVSGSDYIFKTNVEISRGG